MYKNIGPKIKALAVATFIVEAIASVILGVWLIIDGYNGFIGVIILFCGPIVAWVSSWLLYGFGEIVDKVCDMEKNTDTRNVTPKNTNTIAQAKTFTSNAPKKAEKRNSLYNSCNVCGAPRAQTPCEHCGAGKDALLNKLYEDGLITLEEYHAKLLTLQDREARIRKLSTLRKQEIISEEEYKNKISKINNEV